MKTLIQSAVAAAAVAIAAPAMATTITLDNLSTGAGQTVQTNMTSGNVHAGQLNWTVTDIGSSAASLTGLSVGDSLSTFCTQLVQQASSPTVFNVAPVEDAPQPGAGMGALRASYLGALYASFHDVALDSNTNAAAFQLAIWEIVHEDESTVASENFDVTSGDFRAEGGNVFNVASGEAMSAVDLANAWLNSLSNNIDPHGQMFALTNESAQDQLIIVNIIPLPAPMLLAGLGLLAVPVLRRRYNRG